MYRIYIAEDDESIARSVSKGLSGWDFETKCTADFRNIAGEVEEFKPHLVLLDITLPFYNGFYHCSEIRRKSRAVDFRE